VIALARIVRAREALEDGDVGFAAAILFDLEEDLASEGSRLDSFPTSGNFCCPDCGSRFRWPGELDHRQRCAHFVEAA
jgi:hypothetical protein